MADYGLVVSADYKKGGTWAGATEELKRENSLTVFVRSSANAPLGNKKMLDLGALNWPEIKIREKLSQQLADSAKGMKRNKQKNLSLFDFQEQHISQADKSKKDEKTDEPMTEDSPITTPKYTIYEAVLPVIINQLGSPTAVDELSKTLNVSKTQLNSWIKKAVNEGKIRKLSRPVRYEKIKANKFNNMDGVYG